MIEKRSNRLKSSVAMSPPIPTLKKYEQNQTGSMEFSWREKKNNRLKLVVEFSTSDLRRYLWNFPALYARFRQLLGFLFTCPKIDNESKAIPVITFFPPFALFLAP